MPGPIALDQIIANVAGGGRIGVAVSGGADSVFLLSVLSELDAASAVLHVNHQLRGAESDADEAFVRTLADSLGLPYYTASLRPLKGTPNRKPAASATNSSPIQIARGLCDRVATGHTLDDQAETVLFRFIRGSGTAGLSGIRP